MLYYAGVLRSVGEVHDGDTTMDYLEQERDRGITVNSAAISFDWRGSRINLVDTPGHIDFTVEVERCMRVLDGAVTVLDAVAGVQAQTQTVWKQAARYHVPSLIFVNKLDRPGADLDRTLQMIQDRLNVTPLLMQLPVFSPNADRQFRGVIDLVEGCQMIWEQGKVERSREFSKGDVAAEDEGRVRKAREELAEQMSLLDDEFAELYLSKEEASQIGKHEWIAAIRRITASRRGSAVILGSALKNTGVQPLLDGIVDFLPSPNVSAHAAAGIKAQSEGQGEAKSLKALAFKVQHDPMRGALVFLRIYAGSIAAKSVVHNVTRGEKQRVLGLYRAAADDLVSIESASAGDIAVVVGLAKTRTGDTLAASKSAEPLPGLRIPAPVFTASLELESSDQEEKFEEGLATLIRDDPSLCIRKDEETEQTLLSGMGELHLEITASRLKSQFNVGCSLSQMMVAYREGISGEVDASVSSERLSAGVMHTINLSIRISPQPEGVDTPNEVVFMRKGEPVSAKKQVTIGGDTEQPLVLSAEYLEALNAGVANGLQEGPVGGYPVQGVVVGINVDQCSWRKEVPAGLVRAAMVGLMRSAMGKEEAGAVLLEPIATVEVDVPEKHVGAVIGNLTSSEKGATVLDVSPNPADPAKSIIQVEVPLVNVIGYSTTLRSVTSGEGDFSMEVGKYGVARIKKNEQNIEAQNAA